MNKWMQRNRGKLLAVLGVILMVIFILPPAFNRINPGKQVIAYIGKTPITAVEAMEAESEWKLLDGGSLVIKPGQIANQSAQFPLATGILGPLAAQQITQHGRDDMFLLLLREARQMGVQVSTDQVDRVMDACVLVSAPPQGIDVRTAVEHLLMVRNAFDMVNDAAKVSQPLRQYVLAEQYQNLTVNLVEFTAGPHIQDVPAPTTQQVEEQFAHYKDVIAESVDRTVDPFGFGYKYPTRVQLQYVQVARDQVKTAVTRSRSDYDWEVEAAKYYQTHPEEFAATEPQTSPASTQAASGPTTQATTGPTTRPFDAVKNEIRDKLIEQETDRLARRVQDRIYSVLSADWLDYSRKSTDAPAATSAGGAQPPATLPASGAASTSSLGVPYDSFEYLQKLAALVQKELGVLPKIDQVAQYQSLEQLQKLPGIGSAMTSGRDMFATYAMISAEAIVSGNANAQLGALRLWEPSQIMSDITGDSYMFRLTAAQAAHAPADLDVDAIRQKVESDLRLKAAYEQAKVAAEQLLTAAQSSDDLVAAAAAARRPVITAGPFDGTSNTPIANYPLGPDARDAFVQQAITLLNKAAQTGKPHPLQLIELPREGKILVAQLASVQPRWQADDTVQMEMAVDRELRIQQRQFMESQWFDFDDLANRLAYRAVNRGSQQPQQPRQPPINPLM